MWSWVKKWLITFNATKIPLISFDQSNNYCSIDTEMDGSVLEEKSAFKILGLSLTLHLGEILHKNSN